MAFFETRPARRQDNDISATGVVRFLSLPPLPWNQWSLYQALILCHWVWAIKFPVALHTRMACTWENHVQGLRDSLGIPKSFFLECSGSSQVLKGDEVGGPLGAAWRCRILRPDQHVLCISLRAMIQTLGRIKSVSSAFVYIEAGNIQVPASPILDTFATVIITAFRWWMSVDFLKTLDVALEEVMCLQQIFLQGHKPAPATFSHCTVSGTTSECHRCRILRGRTEPRCGTCCCTLWNQDWQNFPTFYYCLFSFFKTNPPDMSWILHLHAMWAQCLQHFPAGSTLQFVRPASGATWEQSGMWRVTRESTRIR